MMEPAGQGASLPRAYLHIGGMTLAQHQLRLVLAMECQRIICIARNVAPELIALQHEAEGAGAQFHIVAGARGLAGLVTANDELLVLAEGLLADPQVARILLDGSHGVLVQPVEAGLPAGFERIDLNHASAGAMRIPGRLVEQLQDLPPDCDVPSALTRIALQAGMAMREVPAAAREGARWRLVRSEEEAHLLEREWIGLHIGTQNGSAPGMFFARLGVLAFGASLLHGGKGSRLALVAAATVMVIGLGAGWLGAVVTAFIFCAASWILLCLGNMLHDVESASLEAGGGFGPGQLLKGMLDLELIVLAVLAMHPSLWDATVIGMAFAPAMLVILTRLMANIIDHKWSALIRDRLVMALLLAFAAGFGVLVETVQFVSLALGMAGLALTGAMTRITRV